MSEQEKAEVVRQMVKSGRELSDEQRSRLRRLHARFDQLWERRERPDAREHGSEQTGRAARV